MCNMFLGMAIAHKFIRALDFLSIINSAIYFISLNSSYCVPSISSHIGSCHCVQKVMLAHNICVIGEKDEC
jgi:hypothetical protein